MIDIKDLPKVPEGWGDWWKKGDTDMRITYEAGDAQTYVTVTEYRGYGRCDVFVAAPRGDLRGERRMAEDAFVRTEDIPAAIRTCAAFVGGPCNAWLVDTD